MLWSGYPAHRDDERLDIVFRSQGHAERGIVLGHRARGAFLHVQIL
jgi:hypothetical protein